MAMRWAVWLAAMTAMGADAEAAKWLRRVTYGLTGLPPTVEEVRGFDGDYGKAVDRLLGSRAYGEHWGRLWLEWVGYADVVGEWHYPDAWRYRDWVVESFRGDNRYDVFVREQVAGDELWPGEARKQIGTGMFCLGGAREVRAARAFQCHGREVERLRGIFGGVEERRLVIGEGAQAWEGAQRALEVRAREFGPAIREVQKRCLEELRGRRLAGLPAAVREAFGVAEAARTAEQKELAGAYEKHLAIGMEEVRECLNAEERGRLEKMERALGELYGAAGEKPLTCGIGNKAGVSGGQRTAWVERLLGEEGEATARVFVERVWAAHFGAGKPDGELVRGFREGWSVKQLQRRIALGAGYRGEAFVGRWLDGVEVADTVAAVSGSGGRRLYERWWRGEKEELGAGCVEKERVMVAGDDVSGAARRMAGRLTAAHAEIGELLEAMFLGLLGRVPGEEERRGGVEMIEGKLKEVGDWEKAVGAAVESVMGSEEFRGLR